MQNKVSVIIPVYNVANYMERCLESVINQTYKNLEILLIDDGSTDDSKEICLKWKEKDNRIRFFYKENEGLGPTRNFGIKKATGNYIMFIDADDWWELDTVEILMETAIENMADIVYMNFYFSEIDDISGKVIEHEFVQYVLFDGVTSIEKMPELLFQPDARMWSKMFRRKLFVENDLYMPSHPYEDFPVLPLLLLKAERICQVNRPLYHYFYKRPGNITGKRENQKYIACGLNELYQKFVAEDYLEKYGDMLSDYMFWMAKKTIDDPVWDCTDEYEFVAKPMWKILEKYCLDKLKLRNKKIFLIGSRSCELICESFLFQSQIIGKQKADIKQSQCPDVDRMMGVDYIFLDFLEIGLYEKYKNSLKDKVLCLFETLENKVLLHKVILLKLYYTEKYGVHSNFCMQYDNIEEIRESNSILEECYRIFEEKAAGRVKAVIDFSEIKNYTYVHTKSGCNPWYYHGKFYLSAGEKIRKELENDR